MHIRILDSFAGIGGFSLAADMLWGPENVTHEFIEIDPFCQAVLRKHWPQATLHDDIKTYRGGPGQLTLSRAGSLANLSPKQAKEKERKMTVQAG